MSSLDSFLLDFPPIFCVRSELVSELSGRFSRSATCCLRTASKERRSLVPQSRSRSGKSASIVVPLTTSRESPTDRITLAGEMIITAGSMHDTA